MMKLDCDYQIVYFISFPFTFVLTWEMHVILFGKHSYKKIITL